MQIEAEYLFRILATGKYLTTSLRFNCGWCSPSMQLELRGSFLHCSRPFPRVIEYPPAKQSSSSISSRILLVEECAMNQVQGLAILPNRVAAPQPQQIDLNPTWVTVPLLHSNYWKHQPPTFWMVSMSSMTWNGIHFGVVSLERPYQISLTNCTGFQCTRHSFKSIIKKYEKRRNIAPHSVAFDPSIFSRGSFDQRSLKIPTFRFDLRVIRLTAASPWPRARPPMHAIPHASDAWRRLRLALSAQLRHVSTTLATHYKDSLWLLGTWRGASPLLPLLGSMWTQPRTPPGRPFRATASALVRTHRSARKDCQHFYTVAASENCVQDGHGLWNVFIL